jgi:tetratricopeptide (TPR) repeat protein
LERAYLLYEQRRWGMAESEAGQALLQQPNDPRALALLAHCLLEQEKFDEATERAKEAVHSAPDAAFTHHALANVWLARNYLDEAEESIRTAISLDPQAPQYHTLLAMIYYRRHQWEFCKAATEAALALDPDDSAAVALRAEALRKMGLKEAARDHLQEQLARDPDDPHTHASLGWNYLEKGNREKAMEHFREALRINPELDWAREGVVETLKTKSRFYRGVLKYFFWISRFPPHVQFGLMIGLFVVYQILVRYLADKPDLAPVLWSVIIVYGLFAFSTWFAAPLSNLLLMLHPFGRLALTRDDRVSASFVGLAFLVAIGAVLYGVIWPSPAHGDLAWTLFSAALTVMCTFATPWPWPRRPMLFYMAVVLVVAATTISLLVLPEDAYRQIPLLTQLRNLIFPAASRLLSWNPLISTLLPNVLMQYVPRR